MASGETWGGVRVTAAAPKAINGKSAIKYLSFIRTSTPEQSRC
jgi:hypothetical protein